MGFKLIEPLRSLFKDETRQLGESWDSARPGLAPTIPGSGPGIRVLASHSKKLEIVRKVTLSYAKKSRRLACRKYLAILHRPAGHPLQSWGDDGRTYDEAVGIRPLLQSTG